MRARYFMPALIAIFAAPFAAFAEDTHAKGPLDWQAWNPGLFARAKAENRFVILDLEAVWCHWCHVMETTTYQDKAVVSLMKSKYLPVRVDQDANPDLSNRYGDWGWPATIVFAPDGTEIVKRRGYIAPEEMAALLDAIIKDPSPGPSVGRDGDVTPAARSILTAPQRGGLIETLSNAYDDKNGGWGDVHKYIDPDSMDWTLLKAESGNAGDTARARQTLDAALHLIDREQGGIYQYSDSEDWTSPHYEKIMWYQANGLRQYSAAYGMWQDANYLKAANDIARYLNTELLSPEGAFYTSQDADVDAAMPGKDYYARSKAERTALGRQPRIDKNIYARENGWAISGLAAYANATGDAPALATAEKAARWIIANRTIDGGGFRHGDNDRAGPYLGDTLAMGQAGLDLYAATGSREWLSVARNAGNYIAAKFKDEAGGFKTTLAAEEKVGVFTKPFKPLDEQIQVTRFAVRMLRYFGTDADRALAEHGMKYLASDDVIEQPRTLAGILLAEHELVHEPTHLTIVGKKGDPEAGALHKAARAYPALNKRLDWWDRQEGPLPNADVTYPELEQAAAFACSNTLCSLPAFSADDLTKTVKRMLAAADHPKTE